MTFIFYDTETTGLEAGFDQILQFAGIVTDDDLNPVEEINFRCRLQPHVVPSPGALVVTGMRPSDIAAANMSHYEMIREIRAVIERHTPAIVVGYNSIGYDEGMLRQAFYQTLNPVYLTNTGGKTRMDVMKLVQAASEYVPGALEIPLNDKGRPSFKLQHLARANGLVHKYAHEAMSDTSVTLGLARLVRERAPAVWDAMMLTRSKQGAQAYMETAEVFCFTDMMFGQRSILATRIAANPDNPSEVAVFDLSHDPIHYLDAPAKDIESLLRTTPRPIRIVKANQNPILAPHALSHAGVAGHGQSSDEMRRKARAVREHPTFAANVATAVADRYPPHDPPEHVEQRIYEGFPSRADERRMATFHAQPWEARVETVSRIKDDRLRELGERLIYIECPEALPDETRRRYDQWRHDRLHADGDVPWVTIGSAFEELDDLRASDDGWNTALLADVETYLMRLRDAA